MGTLTLKKQAAPSLPAANQLRIYVDSADDTLKTIDSVGTIRVGFGVSSQLVTTGLPVDLSGSTPPSVGFVLTALGATSATWAASAGTSLSPTVIHVGPTSFSAAVGDLALVNSTGGLVTVNLPAGAVAGDQIGIKMVGVATFNCNIVPNGADTIDTAGSMLLTTNYEWAILMYNAVNSNWLQIG